MFSDHVRNESARSRSVVRTLGAYGMLCFLLMICLAQQQLSLNVHAKSSFVRPLYAFTGKLFNQLLKSSKNDPSNVIFSPISIHKALSMLSLGVDSDSTTELELRNVMGYANMSDAKVLTYHKEYTRILAKFEKINNRTREILSRKKENEKEKKFRKENDNPGREPIMDLFNMVITKGDGKLLPKYRADVQRYYHSSVVRVEDGIDELLRKLNTWGKKAGFDKPILTKEELSADDLEAMLMSAISVQAFWPRELDEHAKRKQIFYNDGFPGKVRDGAVLSGVKAQGWRYLELTDERSATSLSPAAQRMAELRCKVVKLALVGHLSFTIFEPLEYSRPGDNKLNKLISKLFAKSSWKDNDDDDDDDDDDKDRAKTNLASILELLESEKEADQTDFEITMPKFKFEKELDLKETLQAMGLRKVFERGAEIHSIKDRPLLVAKIIHQAMIEVSKTGIKAAGVTKISVVHFSLKVKSPNLIKVDIKKPFMYLIRYKHIPLFVGQLTRLEGSTASDADDKGKNVKHPRVGR